MLIYKTITSEDMDILLEGYGIMTTPTTCVLSSEDEDTDLYELIEEIDRIRTSADDVIIHDGYASYECDDELYHIIQDNGLHFIVNLK
jgi:hypothetical protein